MPRASRSVVPAALALLLLSATARPVRAQTPEGPLAEASPSELSRAHLEARLRAVEAEMRSVSHQLRPVRRAKVMTIIGFAATAAITVLAVALWAANERLCVDNCDDLGPEKPLGRYLGPAMAPAGLALGLGIAGATLLRRRKARLAPLRERYFGLRLQRRQLRFEMRDR